MGISKSKSPLRVCFVCQPADGSYSGYSLSGRLIKQRSCLWEVRECTGGLPGWCLVTNH